MTDSDNDDKSGDTGAAAATDDAASTSSSDGPTGDDADGLLAAAAKLETTPSNRPAKGDDSAPADSDVPSATEPTPDEDFWSEIAPGEPEPSTPGLRGRLLGLLALVLGAVGVAVSLVLTFVVIVAGFRASSTVDELLAPLDAIFDTVEQRIDQADDAVDRDGIDAERMPELRARAEGLADIANGGASLLDAVRDHPVYRRLPADLEPMIDVIDDLSNRAARIDDAVSSTPEGRPLTRSAAVAVTDDLNALQARVGDAGDAIDDVGNSLKRWIRIAALLGVLLGAWSTWAQFWLARRGLRGLRGHDV